MPVILGKSLHALQLRLARAHTLNCRANGTSTILVGTTLFGRGAKYAPLIGIGLTNLPRFGEDHRGFHLYLSELASSNQF